MQRKTVVINGATIWYDADLLPEIEAGLFDPAWLERSDLITGSSTGRNKAYFLRHRGLEMVLRHFWRGGLVGKINRDLYLRKPVADSRAMQEFELLSWMRTQGLMVPEPVAARYQPCGLFYRADLLTRMIPESRTLAELLREAPLGEQAWQSVGQAVARMHALGVDHSDLNCRNIMMDAAKQVWLIDFDKCARRSEGAWKGENLARLKRSLVKEKGKVPALFWSDPDWQALEAGYRKV